MPKPMLRSSKALFDLETKSKKTIPGSENWRNSSPEKGTTTQKVKCHISKYHEILRGYSLAFHGSVQFFSKTNHFRSGFFSESLFKFWIWDPRINWKSWVFFASCLRCFFQKLILEGIQMRKSWTRKKTEGTKRESAKDEIEDASLVRVWCWYLEVWAWLESSLLPS